MEADLYDEFGNYIGPELESDEESEEEEEADEEDAIEYVSEVVLIDPQRKQTGVKSWTFLLASLSSKRSRNVGKTTLTWAVSVICVTKPYKKVLI